MEKEIKTLFGSFHGEFPDLSSMNSAGEASMVLQQAGWVGIAEGDWARVFTDPKGDIVARVSPWDPAYLLFTEICLRHPEHAYLPRVYQLLHLNSGGSIVFMERLRPADLALATALCCAIGLGNDTGAVDWANSPVDTSIFDEDEEVKQLRQLLEKALEYGASHLPFWGGSDIGPADVMVDGHGRLKVVDPFFVNGGAIVEAILTPHSELLQQIPKAEIEAFLTIPRLEAAYADDPDVAELRRLLNSRP